MSWPGYAGGIVANNGFKPNENCLFWTKYGITVEFLLMEDADARSKAFARGGDSGVDVVWSTVDFLANELPGFIQGGVPARAIMQVDWSRGGDAIVADAAVRTIEDLKGRRIALALLTPSHWLLENALERSTLDDSAQSRILRSVVGKNASPDARADFVAGRVDAAVVWEPDVTEALRARAGSHIIASTATWTDLIADVMIAREDFIERYPDVIKRFIKGWLEGSELANADHELVVTLLMENEPLYGALGREATRSGLTKVKWADLSDNIRMFGLVGSAPLFDSLFSRAGEVWLRRGYIDKAVLPAQAKSDVFLRDIYAESKTPNRP